MCDGLCSSQLFASTSSSTASSAAADTSKDILLPTKAHSSSRGYYAETDAKYWLKSGSSKIPSYAPPARLKYSTHLEYTRALPHHHPSSSAFPDFIFSNLLLLFLSWIACVLYWLLRASDGGKDEYMQSYYEASRISLVCLYLLWLFYFVKVLCRRPSCFVFISMKVTNKSSIQAIYSAHLRLREIPYSNARFRKILFRCFCVQVIDLSRCSITQ